MKILDPHTALEPGCEVWILASLEHSAWTRRIDWYLSFQILRAQPHSMPELKPELMSLLAANEMLAPEMSMMTPAPLMVASDALLPNQKTVVVPFESSNPDWVASSYSVWCGLGRPSIRFFFPDGMTATAFEKAWPTIDRDAEIEYVLPE